MPAYVVKFHKVLLGDNGQVRDAWRAGRRGPALRRAARPLPVFAVVVFVTVLLGHMLIPLDFVHYVWPIVVGAALMVAACLVRASPRPYSDTPLFLQPTD